MDKNAEPQLRVVVVSFYSGQELTDLIDSLYSKILIPFHTIIYNNGGPLDQIKNHISEKNLPNIFIIESKHNYGFAIGINKAALSSLGNPHWTDLLIINPDAKLLDSLDLATFQKIKSLNAIVGPAVFDDANKQHRQMNARSFPNLMTSIANREGLLTKIWPSNPVSRKYLGRDLQGSQTVDWVSGCCFFVSKDHWHKIGGFYEGYFFGVEDVDFGKMAAKKKIPVFYFPDFSIQHVGSLSSKKSFKSEFHHHLGMWVYYIRWTNVLGFLIGPFIFLGIFCRLLIRQLKKIRVSAA